MSTGPELTKEIVAEYVAKHGVTVIQKALTKKPIELKWKDKDVTPQTLDRLRNKKLELLTSRMPGLLFYCGEYIRGNRSWVKHAPRENQLDEAKDHLDSDENLILFGKKSGTGKTTAAHLLAYRMMFDHIGLPKYPDLDDDYYPLSYTGSQLFNEFSVNASKGKSGEFLQRLTDTWLLVVDDLDKVPGTVDQSPPDDTNNSGRTTQPKLPKLLTDTKQQLFFEMVEARTTKSNSDGASWQTILTLNGQGGKLLEKFSDDYREYLKRRLKERFHSINFDPIEATSSDESEE